MDNQDDLIVLIFIIAFLFIIMPSILLVISRAKRKYLTGDKDEWNNLSWENNNCPKCGTPMEFGVHVLYKGILFSPKSDKKPGMFLLNKMIVTNTVSMNLKSTYNKAWQCKSCSYILIDHSKIYK